MDVKWVDLTDYDFVVIVWHFLALAEGVVFLHDYHDQLRHWVEWVRVVMD